MRTFSIISLTLMIALLVYIGLAIAFDAPDCFSGGLCLLCWYCLTIEPLRWTLAQELKYKP